MTKKIKIEFAPGAFDNFDGTQEELDELITEITRMAESGELAENSRPIDIDNPDDEDIEAISHLIAAELSAAQKKLQ
jgi:hypothetical protein